MCIATALRAIRRAEVRLIRIVNPPREQAGGPPVDHSLLAGRELGHAEVLLHQAERVLDEQLGRVDLLDTKASIVLGFDGVVLAILVERLLEDAMSLGPARAPLIVAAVCVTLSSLMAFRVYRPVELVNVPHLRRLRTKYFTWTADELRYLVFYMIEAATVRNEDALRTKVTYLSLSMGFLVFGLLSVLVAAFVN